MKSINPQHIKLLLDRINDSPYYKLLSMEVSKIEKGYSKVEANLQDKHLNPLGTVHGGVYASIMDTAAYWAVYCELEEDVSYTTIDLKIDFLSMITEGRIIVEGRTLKIGRNICLSEITTKDTGGKLIAHGTSKLMILHGQKRE